MAAATGDLADPESLARACAGMDVVISAVQGGPEVIVEGQRTLLAAAEAAGVTRMIPSDFSADISRLDFEDNYNLGLLLGRRKPTDRLHGDLGRRPLYRSGRHRSGDDRPTPSGCGQLAHGEGAAPCARIRIRRRLEALSLGTVEQLRALIEDKKRSAKNPWEWLSLQYAWCGVSGKGKLEYVRRNIRRLTTP
jgi:hypothetical protein